MGVTVLGRGILAGFVLNKDSLYFTHSKGEKLSFIDNLATFPVSIGDNDSSLWNFEAIGANDGGGILFENGSTFSFIIHSSTGNTARSMSHATFTGSKRMVLNTSALGMFVDIDLNGNDLQDIGQIGEAFTASGLSFGTGWGNYGGSTGSVKYKKVGDLVFLRGMAARTSGSGTTIATLPVGYRPSATYYFGTTSNSGASSCYINSSGQIIHNSGGTTWFSLSGIFFGI